MYDGLRSVGALRLFLSRFRDLSPRSHLAVPPTQCRAVAPTQGDESACCCACTGGRWTYQQTTKQQTVPKSVALIAGSVAGVTAATVSFPLEARWPPSHAAPPAEVQQERACADAVLCLLPAGGPPPHDDGREVRFDFVLPQPCDACGGYKSRPAPCALLSAPSTDLLPLSAHNSACNVVEQVQEHSRGCAETPLCYLV